MGTFHAGNNAGSCFGEGCGQTSVPLSGARDAARQEDKADVGAHGDWKLSGHIDGLGGQPDGIRSEHLKSSPRRTLPGGRVACPSASVRSRTRPPLPCRPASRDDIPQALLGADRTLDGLKEEWRAGKSCTSSFSALWGVPGRSCITSLGPLPLNGSSPMAE